MNYFDQNNCDRSICLSIFIYIYQPYLTHLDIFLDEEEIHCPLSVSTGVSCLASSYWELWIQKDSIQYVTLSVLHQVSSHKLCGSWRHMAGLWDLGTLVSSSGTSSSRSHFCVPDLFFPYLNVPCGDVYAVSELRRFVTDDGEDKRGLCEGPPRWRRGGAGVTVVTRGRPRMESVK